ncbi:MAG: MotA/TolQ/ExbB proton channel family protein [candidate division Zixibacteria bacterium]|nr:MotA/TolQ/ExbB proton channel family protein [candidate division Zixibacteria bacterium]
MLLLDNQIWQLVTGADVFSKIILAILVFMSVVSWGVIATKWMQYQKTREDSERFLNTFRRRRSVGEVYTPLSGLRGTFLSRILEQGAKDQAELSRRHAHASPTGGNPHPKLELGAKAEGYLTKDDLDTIAITLKRVAQEEIVRLEKGVSFLATTGNTAPFFGLLGTVWGVMDSFLSIGIRGQATLAVVAPGIAEALIATIVGLAAAIPAVIGYNYCNSRLKTFAAQAEAFGLELLTAFWKESGK